MSRALSDAEVSNEMNKMVCHSMTKKRSHLSNKKPWKRPEKSKSRQMKNLILKKPN
jgi:hypothetical protein